MTLASWRGHFPLLPNKRATHDVALCLGLHGGSLMILIKNVLTNTRRQPELTFSLPPSMMSTQGTHQMEKPLESDSMAHDAFSIILPIRMPRLIGSKSGSTKDNVRHPTRLYWSTLTTINVLTAILVETIIGSWFCLLYRESLETCHNCVTPVRFNLSPNQENV